VANVDVTENVTSITASGVDTDVTATTNTTTVVVDGNGEITLNQQATQIIETYTTTTVEIDENATQLSVVSPHYSSDIPFSTDVSVPHLSSFKSENTVNGITNSFSLGLTDTGADATGRLNVLGANAKLILDASKMDLDGGSLLQMYGTETKLFQSGNLLHIGSEFGQNAQDLGMRFKSYGSPFTGLFAIQNLSIPNSSESLCPSIILEGRISTTTGATQEFMHIGIGGTTSGGYNTRYPIVINPLGFGVRLVYSTNSSFSGLQPIGADGSIDDNAHSLGMQYARWSTVYLASNPIVGSDESLKQDIESLDDAERKVAVACKGLLKKYRLRQSVEEKGDSARIHFGIVAQELQQAFNAEGLDPTRYALFCSDTAYEHEGNIYSQEEAPEEAVAVTRLSVRYEQLLAFIVASI
jgi:hypothetical protein